MALGYSKPVPKSASLPYERLRLVLFLLLGLIWMYILASVSVRSRRLLKEAKTGYGAQRRTRCAVKIGKRVACRGGIIEGKHGLGCHLVSARGGVTLVR